MSEYIAYTDGGCCNYSAYREGGSAYVILHENKIFAKNSKGFRGTSSNRMEILAILSVVNAIPSKSKVLIHSDSKYAIKVLCGTWTAKANTDLIEKFRKKVKEKELIEVAFKWVKGHNGDFYNEMVDSMCTEEINKIVAKYNLHSNGFVKRVGS